MALSGGLILIVLCVAPSTADFALKFQHDVTGTWRRPVVLPCSYVPLNSAQPTVTWLYRGQRIFQRDTTGDHTLITKYRGRLSLPPDQQRGDVSLTIMDLQTDDKGAYTCQVSLSPDGATSRLTMEAEILLAVEKTDFALKFQHDVTGTWRRPVILPCSYVALNSAQPTVTWLYHGQRIFQRDTRGDHTLITKYRGRLSLPPDQQRGDVSLTIMDLQTDDKGAYTCQVSLSPDGATSRITKEAEILLAVEKMSVTEPVIQPGVNFLEVPEGAAINLTCSADGSPPITYKWYKHVSSGSERVFQSEGASLIIEKVVSSHSGSYFCEAENWIPERTVQQSGEFQLRVTDKVPKPTEHTARSPRVISAPTKSPGKERSLQTTWDYSTAAVSTAIFTADLHPSSGRSTWLIILVILLSFALICTLIAVLVTRSKKGKGTDGIYEIPIMSQLDDRANQDPPSASICRMTTGQASGSHANAPWTNDAAKPRKENQYEPLMAREGEKPLSDYKNALLNHNSENEELLAERESVH